MPVRPAIIPCLRYADAPAAILFLCDAFGFLPHAIYPDEEDQRIIHHAQLVLDGNMIMLSSAHDDDAAETYGWVQPVDAGGVTMSLYIVTADIDAHYAAATAAGARIVSPLKDNDGYPGQGYTARDLEGQVWSFGNYDPSAILP